MIHYPNNHPHNYAHGPARCLSIPPQSHQVQVTLRLIPSYPPQHHHYLPHYPIFHHAHHYPHNYFHNYAHGPGV